MADEVLLEILRRRERVESVWNRLREESLIIWPELSRADLSGADLSRANLSRADLSGAELGGVNLSGADLSDANLSRANLSDADLRCLPIIEIATAAYGPASG